jgi:hypothetical protein
LPGIDSNSASRQNGRLNSPYRYAEG